MFCGKCGTQIPEGYEFCMKCGTKADINAFVAGRNTVLANTRKASKKLMILCIPILMILILIGISVFVNLNRKIENKDGLYQNIPWGTSEEEIKTILGDNIRDKKMEYVSADVGNSDPNKGKEESICEDLIKNYRGIKGVDALITYKFNDNRLYKVIVSIGVYNNSTYSAPELVKKYKDEFTKIYGDHHEDSKTYSWHAKKSIVILVDSAENSIILNYLDPAYEMNNK